MGKNNKKEQVILFVEGETDEIFFQTLLRHYRAISKHPIIGCTVINLQGVTRYCNKAIQKIINESTKARKQGYTIRAVCCSYDTDVFDGANPVTIKWKDLERTAAQMCMKELIIINVRQSIEDWILDDLDGICAFLKICKPKNLKGESGANKLIHLYRNARRVYQKGYVTQNMIESLDMEIIRQKRRGELETFERVLGIAD